MDNWDDLRHFLAVARLGSLNAAAKSLDVDPSTVFRRIRSLEQHLGTQVFDRRQHGKYELTAAGEGLMVQAGRIEEATFNIEREVLGQDLQFSGTIRVTTAEDIAVVLLPDHLLAFQQNYPAISIELLTDNRFYSLGRGEADVAIRPAESVNEERVIPRKVCRTYFGLYASPDYLKIAGTPKTREDIGGHQLIRWQGDLVDEGFASITEGLAVRGVSHGSNSLMAQRAMAETGLGIAFLPDFVGDSSTRLNRVLPDLRIDSGFIWILHHGDLRHAARVRAFVEFMYQSLRGDPSLGLG
jgi:DNA-binding transcriptional LysR family regulator